ncbi:hypothetical protein KPG71_17000 [Roseovarius sp. PS-C2]|uniref:hypothetical protein n=1 Tax=Roseovarius sp. PS-C2 TaxID=2820814 RepID=UPI001C0DCC3F|nr:hypothetical protein [Roseovarius sp. PS-C2]MBU3261727.1 hypothetical protein [Roseovarius sp. PS-C2]
MHNQLIDSEVVYDDEEEDNGASLKARYEGRRKKLSELIDEMETEDRKMARSARRILFPSHQKRAG